MYLLPQTPSQNFLTTPTIAEKTNTRLTWSDTLKKRSTARAQPVETTTNYGHTEKSWTDHGKCFWICVS